MNTLFKLSRRHMAAGIAASGLLLISQDRRSHVVLVHRCDPAHEPRYRNASSSWISYISPLSWYRWTTMTSDNYHFLKYSSAASLAGLMSWPSLEAGITQRASDELTARQKIAEFQKLVASKPGVDVLEMKKMKETLYHELTELMYGTGVTVEQRQLHLALYGCAMYTDEALSAIAKIVQNRGIVEIGAGNGQWARQLQDRHNIDILAYDSMDSVPSPYLPGKTETASREESKKYFGEVMQGDENVFQPPDKAKIKGITGRALLIIFPDAGDMAMKCLKSYTSSSTDNDLFIYVGEGRGGANGNDEFFDWLESGEWEILQTLPLNPFGSKGFERLFLFRKVKLQG